MRGGQLKKDKKLFLIMAESEIELIPEELHHYSVVKKYAQSRGKKPSRLLLDSSFHHRAMRLAELPDLQRRGRPDILHTCLLFALDSPLNKKGHLQIYVHTREDKVIWINPVERLPKNYIRFCALIEQLYEEGVISTKKGEELLRIEDKTLKALLEELDSWNVVFWEEGKKVDLVKFFKENIEKRIAVIVGVFPHGDFKKALDLADETVSIGRDKFAASTIVAKAVFSYEMALKGS